MKSIEDITEKDFEKIISFLISELYKDAEDYDDENDAEDGDFTAIISFLEDKYKEDLDFKQIADIHVDPEKKILYLETTFDPEHIDEFVFSIDQKGILSKEILHPDHPLFEIYAREDDDEDE